MGIINRLLYSPPSPTINKLHPIHGRDYTFDGSSDFSKPRTAKICRLAIKDGKIFAEQQKSRPPPKPEVLITVNLNTIAPISELLKIYAKTDAKSMLNSYQVLTVSLNCCGVMLRCFLYNL